MENRPSQLVLQTEEPSYEDLRAKDYLEAGKFFGKEKLDEQREEDDGTHLHVLAGGAG